MKSRAPSFFVGAWLLIVASLTLAAPAHATFPGKNGKIAYAGFGPTDCGIVVVNPDGTGASQITHGPCFVDPSGTGIPHAVFDISPNWSADGRKLVFVRRVLVPAPPYLLRRDDIYSVNADGSGLTQLTTEGKDPAWSPDGRTIAFIRGLPFYGDLFIMRMDGTQVSPIVTGRNSAPEWSPDGKTIAFSSVPPEGNWDRDIHFVNPDGTDDRQITSSEPGSIFYNSNPSWSPDGRRIALTRTDVPFGCCRSDYDVWVMNADGSGLMNLSPDTLDRDDQTPVWSPDGTKIAFATGNGLLRVMNPDGTDKTLVAFTVESRPSWQPIVAPSRSDYKNANGFCKAERDFLGDDDFAERYATNNNRANALGKCVSRP